MFSRVRAAASALNATHSRPFSATCAFSSSLAEVACSSWLQAPQQGRPNIASAAAGQA